MHYRFTGLIAFILMLGLTACDVDQTEEGSLPDVDVEGGNVPEYDIEGPDVSVGTEKKVVEVPDVDVDVDTEKEIIEVPDVDVDIPEE